MSEKLSYRFVENTYPYARVEAALARVFSVPPERIPHLRGRIKHLMQNGLPETRPGKGARTLYDHDTILRWLIALTLEDCSITPAGAVQTAKRLGEFFNFDQWAERALDADSASGRNPVYFTLRPFFVRRAWDEHGPPEWATFTRRWWTGELSPETIAEAIAKWGPGGERHLRDNLRSFRESVEDEGSWGCVRNLSRDLEVLRDGLEPADAGEGAKP